MVYVRYDVSFFVQSMHTCLMLVLSNAIHYMLWGIQRSRRNITCLPGTQHNSKMWEQTSYLYSKTAMYKNQSINNEVISGGSCQCLCLRYSLCLPCRTLLIGPHFSEQWESRVRQYLRDFSMLALWDSIRWDRSFWWMWMKKFIGFIIVCPASFLGWRGDGGSGSQIGP